MKVTPPPAPAPPPEDDDEGLKLDFLFEEEGKQEEEKQEEEVGESTIKGPSLEEAPPKEAAPVQLGNKSKRDGSTEFIIPPQPDVEPGKAPEGTSSPEKAEPKPAPAPPPPAVKDADTYYLQDFASEEIGKAPANWRGEYEYANLVVAELEDADGGARKCMKFEKKSGVGSAYYSCRFPDARGRIGLEFDLRCDDKNKYLLGFYIEKDEDFRQSIHTIVHRTNSSANPTLRIQNESTPYEFGKWAHIKFDIDLTRQLIDCYVDDQPLAMGLRLNSSPRAINTLSIRDNLATTGTMYIGNIRIYRVK